MGMMSRRQVLGALSAAAFGPASARLMAQPGERFPVRPITLWVPWPAGGATDLTMRLLAELAAVEALETTPMVELAAEVVEAAAASVVAAPRRHARPGTRLASG